MAIRWHCASACAPVRPPSARPEPAPIAAPCQPPRAPPIAAPSALPTRAPVAVLLTLQYCGMPPAAACSGVIGPAQPHSSAAPARTDTEPILVSLFIPKPLSYVAAGRRSAPLARRLAVFRRRIRRQLNDAVPQGEPGDVLPIRIASIGF